MLAKIKSFFKFVWEVLEEMGRVRAETHMRNHGHWY
jgi:hypothetical protein